MTAQNRATLKSYFETGDKPTQSQFADLIDSFFLVSGDAFDNVTINNPTVSAGTFNRPVLDVPTVSAGVFNGPTINNVTASAGTFASPSLTGTPVTVTAAASNSGSQIANTAWVQQEIGSTAWTTYVPTITAASGTLTTASATGRYRQIGKTVFVEMILTITTNGTGSGTVRATLPVNPQADAILAGRGNLVSGKALQGAISTSNNLVNITNYDNTYPGASGESLILSGVYESV